MRVFFRLGNAQLLQPQAGNIFTKTIVDGSGRVCGRQMEIFTVAAERNKARQLGETLAPETVERGFGQRAGQLACTVGAEIHEHCDITVLHDAILYGMGFAYGRGFDELIIFIARVCLL